MKMALKETSTGAMIVAVLAAVMMLVNTSASTYYDADCYTSAGNMAYAGELSSTTCDTGYTMVSCGLYAILGNVLGSYIENDICYTEIDSSGTTSRVIAYARCCTLPSGSSCSSVNTRETSSDSLTVDCSSSADNVLVGCSINEDSGNSDEQFEGVYAGAYYSTNSSDVMSSSVISECTGSSFDVSSNPFTTGARCCSTPADYRMECYSVWSVEIGDSYTDACDTGYFLSGCTAMNNYANSMTRYRAYRDTDTCRTGNLNGDAQYVQRTCCRIVEVTPSPSTDPTTEPTLLPTPEPTPALDVCYAQCCSSSSSSTSSGSAVVAAMAVTPVLGSLIEFGEISMIVTDSQAVVFTVGIVAIVAMVVSCLYALLSKFCANNNTKYAGVGKYEIFEKENEDEVENENEDDTELVN